MQHLFSCLLDRSTVIWVNAIGHREPELTLRDLRRAARKLGAMLGRGVRTAPAAEHAAGAARVPCGPRPHVVIEPRVLPWHSSAAIERINHWSLRRALTRALEPLDPADPVVLVTGTPPSASLVGHCGEQASLYFCMDDFLELPGTSPQMLKPLEERLLARVGGVVATAARLIEKKRCATGRAMHLPQGVNYDHFAHPAAPPDDLASLPRPIVGFAGGVGAALDVATIEAVAQRVPEGSVVLVGPVTLPLGSFRSRNVHLLGHRSYAQLPAYVQAFDVGLIPYVENEWTRAVDPLKLLEYLAAGVSVIASPLPEVKKYEHAVRVAPLGEPFADAVAAALAEGHAAREARRAVARAHTWQVRADAFLGFVDGLVGVATGATSSGSQVRARIAS